jgi:hypothetical protein
MSTLTLRSPARYTTRLAAFLALTMVFGISGNAAVQADGPFTSLAGTWFGGGQISLSGGNTERLRCRAYYNPKDGGAALGLAILCASTSYKIELRSQLRSESGRISGTWEERSFNAAGSVSGRATSGNINLSITGGVSATMSVAYGAQQQKVSITTDGAGFDSVTISLSRG